MPTDVVLNAAAEKLRTMDTSIEVYSPRELMREVVRLNKWGYTVDSRLDPKDLLTSGRRYMKLAFASLCLHCSKHVSRIELETDGRMCEHCGKPLYARHELPYISFSFTKESSRSMRLNAQILHDDTVKREYYLDFNFVNKIDPEARVGEDALHYLHRHREEWQLVNLRGKQVLKVSYLPEHSAHRKYEGFVTVHQVLEADLHATGKFRMSKKRALQLMHAPYEFTIKILY